MNRPEIVLKNLTAGILTAYSYFLEHLRRLLLSLSSSKRVFLY